MFVLCRTVYLVLNINDGINEQTDRHCTDNEWKIVESKKARKAKRLKSCMNTAKTQRVLNMNGGRVDKRVRFRNE